MKSWRTITAAALVASAPAAAVFATGACGPSLNLVTIFPLVMCIERADTTSQNVGNGFPFTNNTGTFANYRNQFLYPSSTLSAVSARALTIESVQARNVSFSGNSVNVYGSVATDNRITIGKTSVSSLSRTFAANKTGPSNEFFDFVGPKTVGQVKIGVAQLSDFVTRGPNPLTRNDLTKAIDFRIDPPNKTNILVDTLMRLSTVGNSGFGVWDITSGACSAPTRAYGSGTFVNSNALTTSYGVDTMAFVWVFRGLALPPPSTVQQQIAEIIRLLVTPEGLRCTAIDLQIDGKVGDDALAFPAGKDWDPISPQVSNGGVITGEEGDGGKGRTHGWN